MFFEPPLPPFKGVQPDTPWFTRFKAKVQELQSQQPPAVAEALEASLEEWEKVVATLTTENLFDSREMYCLQQTSLWEIYEASRHQEIEAAVDRMIYNRASKVLDHTPPEGRPVDLTFREGEDLIAKMLDHLQGIALFYQTLVSAVAENHRGAQVIPPTPGFHRTNVLEANADPGQAEGLLQMFLNDNQYVRTILLGDDAAAGATIVDNRLNIPGGGIAPGRGLWVKSYSLLRSKISDWLTLPHDYDQVRCIFISPKGKPSSFLTKSEPLDQTAVSDGILNAADADDPS